MLLYDPWEIADMLDQFGDQPLFTRKVPAAAGSNGRDPHAPFAPEREGPLDVEAELDAMRYGATDGTNVNAVQPRVIASLLMRGEYPDNVIAKVVDATMAMAERSNLTWSREAEVRTVTRRTTSTLRFLQQKHDWRDTGEIPPWLPPEHFDAWARMVALGKRPNFNRNGAGWHVRSYADWSERTKAKPRSSDREDIPGPSAGAQDEAPEQQQQEPQQAPPRPLPRIHPKPFACFDFTRIPQRQWLYGKHYMRGIASATISPGGGGKTTLGLVEALSMATARNLLGEQPAERLHVWYHNGEDGTDELNRRIAAICVHYGIDPRELEGWLFVTSGLEMPIKIAGGNGDVRLNKEVSEAVITGIRGNDIDVLVMDPLITLHSLAEAENHKMDPVLRKFASIANEMNCSIELAHHTRKKVTGQEEYTTADARGASAIIDAVRSARTINGLSENDAKLLDINDEIEVLSYFRLDKGKVNMTRKGASSYYRFVSVELPNGPDGGPGDDVGTVEFVIPPNAAIELSESDITFLVAEVANGDCAEKPQAESWFGYVIAKHFDIDADTGLGRVKIEGVIRDLKQRKLIKVERRKAKHAKPGDRHARNFYARRHRVSGGGDQQPGLCRGTAGCELARLRGCQALQSRSRQRPGAGPDQRRDPRSRAAQPDQGRTTAQQDSEASRPPSSKLLRPCAPGPG
jgi:hypothetical protein